MANSLTPVRSAKDKEDHCVHDAILPFDEFPSQSAQCNTSPTIVLIHGAGPNAGEWDLVVKYLTPAYHVIVPDLPHHARASNIIPFTIPDSSTRIGNLIRKHAHNGRAHIIGLSLGGHIAVDMAARHPEVLLSVFASGWRYWGQPWYTPLIPSVLYFEGTIEEAIPRSWIKWATGADVRRAEPGTRSFARTKEFVAALTSQVVKPAGMIEGGVLVVAATALGDTAENAKMVAGLLKGDGIAGTRVEAMYNKKLVHAWNGQEPELFAQVAIAFIEGKSLPVDFVTCD